MGNIMVIRIEKIANNKKIDNNYLEDKNIFLKVKGLLILMLSMSDDWKFNIKSLCLLCKECKLAVTNTLKELKENNYLEIEKGFDYDCKFLYEYSIYENSYILKAFVDLRDMDN